MSRTDAASPFAHKIRPRHCERLAVVYVRQSTPQQLVGDRESADEQYQLRRRVVALGWADDRVGTPTIVAAAGAGAEFAWDESFKGQLANAYTRRNYAHAVRDFLAWCDRPDRQVPLIRITPGHVGDYLAGLELATPTKKLRLAALRKFFDVMVVRHVVA